MKLISSVFLNPWNLLGWSESELPCPSSFSAFGTGAVESLPKDLFIIFFWRVPSCLCASPLLPYPTTTKDTGLFLFGGKVSPKQCSRGLKVAPGNSWPTKPNIGPKYTVMLGPCSDRNNQQYLGATKVILNGAGKTWNCMKWLGSKQSPTHTRQAPLTSVLYISSHRLFLFFLFMHLFIILEYSFFLNFF